MLFASPAAGKPTKPVRPLFATPLFGGVAGCFIMLAIAETVVTALRVVASPAGLHLFCLHALAFLFSSLHHPHSLPPYTLHPHSLPPFMHLSALVVSLSSFFHLAPSSTVNPDKKLSPQYHCSASYVCSSSSTSEPCHRREPKRPESPREWRARRGRLHGRISE